METCCGYAYDRGPGPIPPRDFQGPSGALRTRRNNHRAQPTSGPLLRVNRFRGFGSSRREDSPSRGSRQRLAARSRCRQRPGARFRNVNRIPFRRQGREGPSPTELPCALGSTDPCPNTVSMEPFPTSVFKFSRSNICYFHQDLHQGPFHPASPPGLRHGPPRLPTRPGLKAWPDGEVWVATL